MVNMFNCTNHTKLFKSSDDGKIEIGIGYISLGSTNHFVPPK
jgi:hypothetical protein